MGEALEQFALRRTLASTESSQELREGIVRGRHGRDALTGEASVPRGLFWPIREAAQIDLRRGPARLGIGRPNSPLPAGWNALT
jgi:hypothetical protein